MRRLESLLQQYGFTRNEVRALVFLGGTFLAGLLLRFFALSPPSSMPIHPGVREDSTLARLAPASPSPVRRERNPDVGPDAASGRGGGRTRFPVDINRAGRTELMALPGIGESYAGRILALRRELGRFRRPEDLLLVQGIGPRTLERLRPLITLGGTPPDSLTP